MFFSRMVNMVLVLWEVSPILGNGYGIKLKHYVDLLQNCEMSTELPPKKLKLGIKCFRITIQNVY